MNIFAKNKPDNLLPSLWTIVNPINLYMSHLAEEIKFTVDQNFELPSSVSQIIRLRNEYYKVVSKIYFRRNQSSIFIK